MTALSGVQEKFSCFPSASAISAISISSNIILARYSSRFNFDIACNMDFHRSWLWRWIFLCEYLAGRFPVDEQYCQIKFESFGFTNKQVEKLTDPERFYILSKQIKLSWMDESQNNVNKNISLAQFGFKWEPILCIFIILDLNIMFHIDWQSHAFLTIFYLDVFQWTKMLMDKGMCAGLSIWYMYPRVTLMDAYSTDYYDISYPGLIMKVNLVFR